MKNAWLFIALILFAACSRKAAVSASGGSGGSGSGKNNLLVTKETNVAKSHGRADKIEFDGSNNVFDLVQKNAAFFDGREIVIIVQGNNNIIKLYNTNLVDMSAPGMDTLLLVGDHTKYVMDVRNKIVLKDKHLKADTIQMQQKSFSATDFSTDFKSTDMRIKMLTDRLSTNDPEAFYDLANLYQYEVNTKEGTLKAIEYYEYAATYNHLEAIRKLGDIFANGTFDLSKNLKKAQYFFTLGANLGDSYSKERLAELQK
jgi:hypothetical protein